VILVAGAALLAACSSDHAANPDAPPPATASSAATDATDATDAGGSQPDATSAPSTGSTPTSSGGSSPTTGPATTASPSLEVTGRAVAGAVAAVETAEPFAQTDPFAEAVRLADGTCVGWSGSRGGSTAGLVPGASVTLLDVEDNTEIGQGTITSSRWEDMAGGAGQWNCMFDFAATLTEPHAEFRIKVGPLSPWLAGPDPTDPGTFTASVSTDASIGAIAECPALPATPDPTATTAAPTTTLVPPPTTPVAAPASGWTAVGQYWSDGVRSLCAAGLPVTAIARPCRPAGAGSEYIVQVVDSNDPTAIYANGAAVPAGTAVTVVVATGRPCA
jgi:hypothetical protein